MISVWGVDHGEPVSKGLSNWVQDNRNPPKGNEKVKQTHKTVPVKVGRKTVPVDRKIAPGVKAMNDHGVCTSFSCQGHYIPGQLYRNEKGKTRFSLFPKGERKTGQVVLAENRHSKTRKQLPKRYDVTSFRDYKGKTRTVINWNPATTRSRRVNRDLGNLR